MKIYKDEIAIAEEIKKNTSLSFDMEPQEVNDQDIARIKLKGKDTSLANIGDEDLFYHKSILVTTNWNKNDDVFVPEEVWLAKSTPEHKPTNLNHQSSSIVGHMTGNWAVDADGEIIPDETEIQDLPSKFHILTGAVIYKRYHNDEDYEATVADLIEEIREKKQYVSMECSLSDFDYAIQDSDGQISIIQRNDETSFLTKHLRRYGGTGVYESFKIGRVLRGISFIGKAYTPKPANSESVIFTEEDVFDFANASFFEKIDPEKINSVVSSSNIDFNGDNLMSDVLEKQITELKEANTSLSEQLEDLKSKLAKADVEKYEAQIEDLTAKATSLEEDATAKDAEIKSKKEALEKAEAALEEVTKAKEDLEADLAKINLEKVKATRVSTLVEGGYDKESAEAKVELFTDFSDDQFKAVADELVAAKVYKKDEEKDEKNKEDDSTADEVEDATAEEADLDETESDEDTSLAEDTSEEDDSEEDTAIASLVDKLKTQLTTVNKKGDK